LLHANSVSAERNVLVTPTGVVLLPRVRYDMSTSVLCPASRKPQTENGMASPGATSQACLTFRHGDSPRPAHQPRQSKGDLLVFVYL
jgi:hypothetical protein